MEHADELTAKTTFEGSWSGDGWDFDLALVIDKVSGGAVEGHTKWTLRAVPKKYEDEYGPKVGGSAKELWKGKRDGRQLAAEGYETEDPAGIIAEGKYQLVLLTQQLIKH